MRIETQPVQSTNSGEVFRWRGLRPEADTAALGLLLALERQRKYQLLQDQEEIVEGSRWGLVNGTLPKVVSKVQGTPAPHTIPELRHPL